MERDSVTGNVVLPADPARASAAECLGWAVRSSSDNFTGEARVTRNSSNPYILFAGSFIGDYTGTAVGADGHLAVCAFPLLATTILPQLLSRFRGEHPKLSITLNGVSNFQLMMEVLGTYELDFALSEVSQAVISHAFREQHIEILCPIEVSLCSSACAWVATAGGYARRESNTIKRVTRARCAMESTPRHRTLHPWPFTDSSAWPLSGGVHRGVF